MFYRCYCGVTFGYYLLHHEVMYLFVYFFFSDTTHIYFNNNLPVFIENLLIFNYLLL